MARKPLHLRVISSRNSHALNMRIADAIMDFVEEQGNVRDYNTPEEVSMLQHVQRALREIERNQRNATENMAFLTSVMLK